MSSSGGIDTAIDRIEAIGGDCVQVFTQSPRMWRPTEPQAGGDRALPREARARRGSAASSATRSTSATSRRPTTRSTRSRSQAMRDDRRRRRAAIEADGVIFHVGSHLGAGFEAGLERDVAALTQILERCDGDTWLLMENSAGSGGDDRPLARRARGAGRAARPPSAARHLPRLVPPLRLGLRRHRPRRGRRSSSPRSTDASASTGCARCTSTTAPRRSARTATATRTSSRA